MRLSISNIAWDSTEDEAIVSMLHRYELDAIDVAPGKYFPDPLTASDEDISRVRRWWAERGIGIAGMQALLFGTSGLNIFGNASVQDAMLAHLDAVCRIGGGLGAKHLVFGSPRNRDRSGLDDAQMDEAAAVFFGRLGDIAASHGVVVCLEPNPARYGANFMTTSDETAKVVKSVAHPSIRMQFDTGSLTLNKEDPLAVLQTWAPLVSHVHASEPDLLPLGDGSTDHAAMFEAIKRYLPDRIVTVEMVATSGESHLVSVERALATAVHYYRQASDGQTE